MKRPPPGYDDESVIARGRLTQLLDKLEKELSKVKKVAVKNLPIEPNLQRAVENDFWHFRHASEELGIEYSRGVEKLIVIYNDFLHSPSEEKFAAVMKELSELKILLGTH